MKRYFLGDATLAVLYIVLGGILFRKGALTLKTTVAILGIILLVGGAVLFFSTSGQSRRLGVAVACVGVVVVLFHPFVASLLLILCGGGIVIWGFLCYQKHDSLIAVADVVIGITLIASVFVLKKFLLLVCATLMLACATARLLVLFGVFKL